MGAPSAATLARASPRMRLARPSAIQAPPSRRIPHFVITRAARGDRAAKARATRRSLCPASASLPYTDGVLVNDSQFDTNFPFLWPGIPGSPNGSNGVDPTGATPYVKSMVDDL